MSLCTRLLFCLPGAAALLSSTGCVMKRTVTEGGQVVSENYVVERPVRDALRGEQSTDSR